MLDFAYHRPTSLAEAVRLFGTGGEARYLAGGQSLIPLLKHRLAFAETIIDLGAVPGLDQVTVAGGVAVIGARATHAAVAAAPALRQAAPALAALAEGIGDPQVRNRGTLGGSLAHADPAADYAAALLALDANVVTDRRRLAAGAFYTALFETALEPGEIVLAVEFPLPDKAVYLKLRHPASRYAVAGVMVAVVGGGVRVAVTGAAPVPFRAAACEDALGGGLDPARLDRVRFDPTGWNEDVHASAAYRADVVATLARRAVAALG